MNNVKERNSSYELMRIVSMFLIVLYHVIVHGKMIENCENAGLKILLELIKFFTLVHVNSFILVTGYFQINSKFNQKKLWSLIGSNWFYRLAIMILFSVFGIVNLDKVTMVMEGFPINLNEYWFFKNYLLLYCLVPFINKGILSMNKKTFQKMIIVMFIVFSIAPAVTGGEFFFNNGFSLYQFVFLYILGAYLRKYPIDKSYIFKIMSKNMYKIVLITIFFVCFISNYVLYSYADSISWINSGFKTISNYIRWTSLNYSCPFVIIQSIAYFLYFGTLDFKNKFINKIASLTFGIYLIHDNNFMRRNIYIWLKIDNGPIYSYNFIIYMFVIAIVIFIVCMLIEFIRQTFCRKIQNLKLIQSLKDKYYNFIRNIFFINDKNSE